MKNKLIDVYIKMSKTEKKVLGAAVMLVGLAFADRVILTPVMTTLAHQAASIREQESSIKKSMNVLLHKDGIIAESRDYMSYSVEAKDPEQEMVALLKEVEAIAERSGVTLAFVKPAATKEEEKVKRYYCTLECEGPMDKMATFFHGIESSNKLLKIEKYQLQPKAKESSIARAALTIYKTVLS
jgi:Tfp pilus assembly protein PilO